MEPEQFNLLDKRSLENVFVSQLSLLYAAKTHLINSLPALANQAAFATLKHALKESLEDSKKQMTSIRAVFRKLNQSALTENCLGMNAIIKEAYESVSYLNGKNYESDMSIIFYMGVVEHMQVGAGRMLNLIGQNENYSAYTQLISETLDMSTDNADLFHFIAAEYIQKH